MFWTCGAYRTGTLKWGVERIGDWKDYKVKSTVQPGDMEGIVGLSEVLRKYHFSNFYYSD